MKIKSVLLLFTLLFTDHVFSQLTSDQKTFDIQAVIQTAPASIKLKWVLTANNTKITIRRKLKEDTSWGTSTVLADNTIEYTDNAVVTGKIYEYHLASSVGAYTYISVGLDVPLVDYRGKVLLVVEKSIVSALSSELNRWMMDVRADGWQVIKIEVNKTDLPADVRLLMKNTYNLDPVNTKSAFILGQVPLPLSGCLMPDGHGDHYGAWAADSYYADLDGTWTDASSNCSGNFNANVPGDGKFDQSSIPGATELQIGRVDMRNLPAFSETETVLLKRYLDKDHSFRMGDNFYPEKGYILDFFPGETGGLSGFYLFRSLFGNSNTMRVGTNDIRRGFSLWLSVSSGGQPDGFEEVPWGSSDYWMSSNFAAEQFNYVFTQLFGSYFGDYQMSNNFMRSALASRGSILTCCWSGRPAVYYHHMANGENIGYSARINQNCPGIYAESGKAVYVNLLGDPTLRQDMMRTPVNVKSSNITGHIKLTWSPPVKDSLDGYHIYKAKGIDSVFVRQTISAITDTFWTDPAAADPTYYYIVKAVRLQKNRCGSYYNSSRGIFATNDVAVTDYQQTYVYPKPYVANPIPDQTSLIKKSFSYTIPADVFGDSNPNAILNCEIFKKDSNALPKGFYYTAYKRLLNISPQPQKPVVYELVYKTTDGAGNVAFDTFKISIIDTTTPPVNPHLNDFNSTPLTIYPNPASTTTLLKYTSDCSCMVFIVISDLTGTTIYSGQVLATTGENTFELNCDGIPEGAYIVMVNTAADSRKGKLQIVK